MNKNKILITGGAGFVGSQLGHRLHQTGHEVVLLDNMSFGHLDNLVVEGNSFGRLVVQDICSSRKRPLASSLEESLKNVDTVFHFAGISALPVCQTNPGLAFEINTAGVADVLEASRRAGVRRVIFSSTSAVYENSEKSQLSEEDNIHPDLVYALTKAQGESICQTYSKNYDMDILVVRFFNLYGAHQDFKRTSPPFTSYLAREFVAKRAPRLFNKSDVKRDYVYISDVIDLLEKMMISEKPYRSDIFNIGSGVGFSVPEIYKKMCAITGQNLIPEFKDPENFWDSYPDLFAPPYSFHRSRISKEVFKNAIANTEKTFKEFGWRASTSMDVGLKKVYQYALERSESI